MRLLRPIAVAMLLAAPLHGAMAQSAPLFTLGQVPTPAQWHAYFSGKQDALGYTPLSVNGGTLSGRLVTAPGTSQGAGINIAPGAAPSAPASGDLWVTPSGLYAAVGGQTYNLSSPTPLSQTVYPLIGNGVSVAFTLPVAVDVAHTVVSIGGLIQAPNNAYSISGAALTFAAPPPIGAPISVAVGPLTSIPQAAGSALQQQDFSFTGDGTSTTFSFPAQATTTVRYQVTIGGVAQSRSSCTISSSALTCVAPPPDGTDIEVVIGP